VNWDLTLLLSLIALAAASDLTAIESPGPGVKLSGSFLAIVLAMVFLGGVPAALVGVCAVVVGWLRWRDPPPLLLGNVVTYAAFPLIGGLSFAAVRDGVPLNRTHAGFYVAIFVLYALALSLNFAFVAGFLRLTSGTPLRVSINRVLVPALPSELPAALLALTIAYMYVRIGVAALALLAVVIFSFQTVLHRLFQSEQRRDTLEERTHQLSRFQLELLATLLRTLDLRDRMTARHSAAVARYAREIARAAGLTARDEEIVHTAALLHDIGKVELSDRILKGDQSLSIADWEVIRKHPERGATLVSRIDGYADVADVIRAHHERVDGTGYPYRLRGDGIPALARIVAIADAYDVMTARDSYRTPGTSSDAVAELRRAAGTQFDIQFVSVFVELLAGKDVRYRHGEDADFDAELAREKHVYGPGVDGRRFGRSEALPVTAS
jgi:putative nucleotidyltransferase with HDIG domain